uniref:Uncharacterized protein n=1 Tax=Stegastes partitus TaxID=144197 RepID=A0A3B5B250_9TELE
VDSPQLHQDLLCSICLDVFTDPVTIPCGHHFCKSCITQSWTVNVHISVPYPHLGPNHRVPGLKRHQLMDPVKNLEDKLCKTHDRPLEVFCKTDQVCVCLFCNEVKHKLHPIQAEQGEKQAESQQNIEERRLKMDQIRASVKLSKEGADRETAASVQVFTALIQSVVRGLAQLIHMFEEKQKSTEAKGFTKELSHTEDQLLFLQSFPSLNPAPPTKDWTEVRVHSSYEGSVRRAVAQLEETLSEEARKLYKNMEMKRVWHFAVEVTLDPDTANPYLILSEDGKQVSHGAIKQNVPDSPERFSSCCILGKQNVSSGRCYYEVQSINRKDFFTLSPKNDHWTVCLMNGHQYKALASPSIQLTLKSQHEKVGVFVDYEKGQVSFYDVDATALIYSFTGCNFTEKIYSCFNSCYHDGGKNSIPLIICPVNHTD